MRAATLRQAARLVDEEFWIALCTIRLMVENKIWGEVSDLEATIANWEEHKTILARELPTSVWDPVFKAHAIVKQLLALHAVKPASTAELANHALELVKPFYERIEKGRAALAPFITSDPSSHNTANR